jgi:hypothetical protein
MLSVMPQISCSPASVKTLDFFYYTTKHKILKFYCPQLIDRRQVQNPEVALICRRIETMRQMRQLRRVALWPGAPRQF